MQKIGLYIRDAFNELVHKVTWPTWKELQSSAIVVMVASVIIALIIFLMDKAFQELLSLFYNLFQ